MRPSLIIDPSLFAMPAVIRSEEALAEFLQKLLDLSEASRDEKWFSTYYVGEALSILVRANLYPTPSVISDFISKHRLQSVYAMNDIRRAINELIQRSNYIEELSNVEFLIPQKVNTVPDILSYFATGELVEGLEVTLCHSGLVLKKEDCAGRLAMIITNPNVHGMIEAECIVGDILSPLFDEHLKLHFAIPIARSAADFQEKIPPLCLWRKDSSDDEVELAIRLEALSLMRSANMASCVTDVPEFRVGRNFLDSLRRNQGIGGGKFGTTTLDCCAHLVAGIEKYRIGPIKRKSRAKGKGLVPVQRNPDGAAGRRTHISKSNEGMRLMFWQLDDGIVEFANIGPKNELIIED